MNSAAYENYGGDEGEGGAGYVANSGTSQSPSQNRKNYEVEEHPMMALTIRQALESTYEGENAFKVDGKQLDLIRLCGYVSEITIQAAYNVYRIDDGTGSISAKWSIDENTFKISMRDLIREGSYIRVLGYLRSTKGSLHILAVDIRPITDFNQYTHHFLEVISCHLYNTKGLINSFVSPSSVANQQQQQSNIYDHGMTSMALPPVKQPQQQMQFNLGAGAGDSGMTDLQKRVINLYTELDCDDGVNQDLVIKVLQKEGFNDIDVRQAISFLTDEGHLYSTSDDFHQRITG